MRIDKTLTAGVMAVGLALGGGAALPAFAQENPAVAPETPAVDAASFSDEQLESFVDAAVAVTEIQTETQTALAEVEDEAEMNAMVEAANGEIVEAIGATPGITVDEYVAVVAAAEADPAFRQRLEGMIVAAQTE